ncbi:hypothetical protein Q5424_10520 [Conexibacter sp. JD483]|uniref:hypothetical protein n=1 Tax=unclassified Conexibacter TaxID=2627773 RepID=UPI00271E6EAC|nr:MULTISPECIES: hypothetical protein [unclassified Conexibacter]MDO8187802.1 hypothetical protein [Conexibacter sp. CPCC 205706]MDO8199989.1 hypothetical protein [Conexibacter sp. CPCC 205762]MDR9369516.1 hypothetical protein [Conexibacter sp. JD483]
MFNALTPPQLLAGVGRVLRASADADGALEDYQRSQVLSAYSVTRLLAGELQGADALRAWTRAALLDALAGDGRPPAVAAREQLADPAVGGVRIGELVADLLAALPRAGADPVRDAVRAILRELADREQAALAAPLDGGAR